MKTPSTSFLRAFAPAVAFTLVVDGIFLLAVFVSPFVPYAAVIAAIGGMVLLANLHTASRGEVALPRMWILPAVLLPSTTYVNMTDVEKGWKGEPSHRRYQLGASVLIIALAMAAGTGRFEAYCAASGMARADTHAEDYLKRAWKRAAATWATARMINATISVLKDFSITPVVVEIPLGKILDPIDDMVERFSVVMLVATAALTAQLILLKVGSSVGLTVFLPIAFALMLIGAWLPNAAHGRKATRLGITVALVGLIARFAIPVAAVTGEAVSKRFLHPVAEEANQEFRAVSKALNDDAEAVQRMESELDEQSEPGGKMGFLTKFKELPAKLAAMARGLNMGARLKALNERLNGFAEHAVRLIAVWTLEAVAFPLFVAWSLLKVLGHIVGDPGQLQGYTDRFINRMGRPIRHGEAGSPGADQSL